MSIALPRLRPALPTIPDPRPRIRAAVDQFRAAVRDARQSEAQLRSVLDAVAPDWVEVTPDTYVVGNSTTGDEWHTATLVARDWPASVAAGWLAPALFGCGGDVSVALHTTRLSKSAARRLLKTQRVLQTSVAQARAERGAIADPAEEMDLQSAATLAPLVEENAEALFSASLVLTLRAPDAEALRALITRVRDALNVPELGGMRWQQRAGYLTAGVPYAADHLGRRRTIDTTTLAFTFPFLHGNVGTRRGPLWGIAQADRSPVRLDLWSRDEGWKAPHVVLIGPTGGGKTVTAGHLLAEHATQADPPDIIIVDPVKGDYRRFVRELGGQVVRLSTGSDQSINAFDLPPAVIQSGTGEEAPQNPVLVQTRLSAGLIALMVAETDQPLRKAERAAIETAILQAYASKGIRPDDPLTWDAGPQGVPVLPDVLQELEADTQSAAAQSVAERLRPFCTGTLSGLFSRPTSLRLGSGITSLDLEGMDSELRPLAVWLIGNLVWKLAKRDRRRRIVVLEEVKPLLSYPESALMVAELYSLGRAYGLSVWAATQLATDFTSTPEGLRAIENANTRLVFDGTVGHCLLTTPRGEARIEVVPSPWELELMGGPAAPDLEAMGLR